MLSGSALVRVIVLVVAAAALAGLVQAFWPSSGLETSPDPRPAPTSAEVRRIEPRPVPTPSAPTPSSPPPAPVATPAPPPAPSPQPAPPVFDAPPRAEPDPAPPQDAASAAADSAGPRALSVVDLNTASLAELNRLQGGGSIGKAIVRGRPYSSVDQLLSKRVLSKSTYQRIKDQVAVR